ncbi:CPBP family intramembrane metalloprotease [Luteolibacter flavescens]|uniref:CPBP family intramembrane metalloprotease n=1 Tax=Luteolibacter flavescens TaxID=1859460 RepID=A0ABT3FKG2_9BACT|nr:type II CAAX endopeptidase family protein [Luteolibacter flavescens]MCW1884041.1 CPBP family intramembrane metalloprotease [Luteolibacter flavescens]
MGTFLASNLAAIALGPDAIVLGVFALAAVIFLVSWAIRALTGKMEPFSESFPAPPISAEDAALLKPAGDPDSPYAPPGELPPPLPATADPAPAIGSFKVSTAPYRFFDLPLIGMVFLVFMGLTAMNSGGGGEEIPLDKKYTPGVLIASIVFQFIIMGMVLAFVTWRVKIIDWLGLRWRQWPFVFAIAPVTVFFMWCFMGVLFISGWNTWLEKSLGIESMQEAVKVFQEVKDPLVIALMAVTAALVAPLAEEVVFRGYLYPAAKRFCGPAGAILFSSLVFSAAHGHVVALLPLFILAVVLCLLYEFTGSLWACISVHFLFNAATVTIQLLQRSGMLDAQTPS